MSNHTLRSFGIAFLSTLFIVTALTGALFLQSCSKSEVRQLADSLRAAKPAGITEISEHKNTFIVVVETTPDSIGLLEQAHAVRCIVKHKDLFDKALNAMQHTEGSHLRLTFQAKGGADRQDFDYNCETLKPILDDPDKALREAEEWLKLLEEDDTVFGEATPQP